MTQAAATESLRLTRLIPAPRQRVFDAWVDPAQRMKWWAAGPGMFCDLCEIDARPGGSYRINMKKPADADGPAKEWVCVGEMVEFDRPSRLAFTWSWEHEDEDTPGSAARDTLVTIELRDAGGQTELVLTHERFATRPIRDDHESGWNGCLDHLAQYLAA